MKTTIFASMGRKKTEPVAYQVLCETLADAMRFGKAKLDPNFVAKLTVLVVAYVTEVAHETRKGNMAQVSHALHLILKIPNNIKSIVRNQQIKGGINTVIKKYESNMNEFLLSDDRDYLEEQGYVEAREQTFLDEIEALK